MLEQRFLVLGSHHRHGGCQARNRRRFAFAGGRGFPGRRHVIGCGATADDQNTCHQYPQGSFHFETLPLFQSKDSGVVNHVAAHDGQ